nr:MAG TPA: hypothetical protein [Caudoviricetes sp.]
MSKALDMARELVKQLEEAEKKNKVRLSELKPGETFKIGEHDFVVLMQAHNYATVISKGFMAENVEFDKRSTDYNKSNLKKIIEADIQPIIENALGAENLVEHTVNLASVDMQHEYKDCVCKVRPITFDEAREFNDLLVNKDLDDWWWTCTPWSTKERGWEYSIAVVTPSGDVGNDGCNDDNGVRPFCILKSHIFVSKGE